MRIYVAFTVVIIMLSSAGCTATASLFPVEGPLSEIQPLPVIKAKATGVTGNSGKMELTMPDGEYCEGRWSSAAGAGITISSGSLIGTYGSVYGSGFSVSPGRGQNPGVAMLTCDQGRVINVEFITGAGTANGFGFAKDNKGNVYRVLF